MSDETAPSLEPSDDAPETKVSYKFQRVRERLREAIRLGKLRGKLPGERQLARRLQVNAKTLAKALTDLAAEGLLDRRIGLGTFVRSDPAGEPTTLAEQGERWMVLCDQPAPWSAVIDRLNTLRGNSQLRSRIADCRPGMLAQLDVVIDFNPSTPEHLVRDLIIRGITVIKVGHAPRSYGTSAVLLDRAQAAAGLARQLLLDGHRSLLVVESPGETEVGMAVRHVVDRMNFGATVEVGAANDAVAAVEDGAVTAVLCDTLAAAELVRDSLGSAGRGATVAVALGIHDTPPFPGCYLTTEQVASSIVHLARSASPRRPSQLWLVGEYFPGSEMTAPPIAEGHRPGDMPA
jgi:DNA-binding HxlR family transcriptional regulator